MSTEVRVLSAKNVELREVPFFITWNGGQHNAKLLCMLRLKSGIKSF